jgi:hypothetical protein
VYDEDMNDATMKAVKESEKERKRERERAKILGSDF